MRSITLVTSFISEVAGPSRYRTGNLLLAIFFRLHGKKPPDELFAAGWRFIHSIRWLFRGREQGGNRHGVDWRNFAYMRLLIGVKKRYPDFVPEILVSGDEALTKLVAKNAAIMIVSVHARFGAVLARICEERSLEYCAIARKGEVPISRLLGAKGPVDFIKQSENSLIEARRKLKQGKAVISWVDFTQPKPGTWHSCQFIAEDVFRFAARCGAQVVYARASLSSSAKILVEFTSSGMSPQTPNALIEEFIDFLRAGGDQRPWKSTPFGNRFDLPKSSAESA